MCAFIDIKLKGVQTLVCYCAEHSRKHLDWPDKVKVADGVAKGLLYLHENNIIYRDLTTNNTENIINSKSPCPESLDNLLTTISCPLES